MTILVLRKLLPNYESLSKSSGKNQISLLKEHQSSFELKLTSTRYCLPGLDKSHDISISLRIPRQRNLPATAMVLVFRSKEKLKCTGNAGVNHAQV